MITDYKNALQFVEDYFQLNYSSFLNKYFKGSRQNEITRNITPAKFKQLFGELSPTQLKIINDNETQHIVVAAGPGSGKTKTLVHKLASLLLIEDVKHEQLLMITFSRAAATEFKKRLLKLIGNAANYVEIKTFHSYCFDLLGRVGSLEKSEDILKRLFRK
jgi:ATP-dependent DNA helicase RecQ